MDGECQGPTTIIGAIHDSPFTLTPGRHFAVCRAVRRGFSEVFKYLIVPLLW